MEDHEQFDGLYMTILQKGQGINNFFDSFLFPPKCLFTLKNVFAQPISSINHKIEHPSSTQTIR